MTQKKETKKLLTRKRLNVILKRSLKERQRCSLKTERSEKRTEAKDNFSMESLILAQDERWRRA